MANVGMRRSVTIGELLDAAHVRALSSMVKVMPGVVQTVTAAVAGQSPALVDVQPAVHDVRFDTFLGTRVSEPWPVITGVPLACLTFGAMVVAGTPSVGDEVTLLSFDLDPTTFRATGQPSDPVDTRRHGGSYWQALPCGISNPKALAGPQAPGILIGTPGGACLAVTADGVSLGAEGASAAVALATKVDSFISLLLETYTAAGTETGFASLITALSAWKTANWTSSTTVGATKVNGV